jgi:hypothetical protein
MLGVHELCASGTMARSTERLGGRKRALARARQYEGRGGEGGGRGR